MIRTSKHIASNANQHKLDLLDTLYSDYRELLQMYVQMILNQQLPQKSFLSSKDLPTVNSITHSQWKQVAYKQAKHKSSGKVYKKTMNKLQRWSYDRTFIKLEQLSESKGFTIKKVDPVQNVVVFIKRAVKANFMNV